MVDEDDKDRITVHPVTPERWPDLVAVFGTRGANASWCWCQQWTPRGRTTGDNRSALQGELEAELPPGLLAYRDDEPVGWARVGPRAGYPLVTENRALSRLTADGADAWWTACFAVRTGHRGTGVGVALLRGAIDFAREHGARTLEGYPVDVGALTAKKVGTSGLYTGTRSMFVAAGFEEVARTVPTRPIMRRLLTEPLTG
jgi:GNAT superfamily N-acetyltransferase